MLLDYGAKVPARFWRALLDNGPKVPVLLRLPILDYRIESFSLDLDGDLRLRHGSSFTVFVGALPLRHESVPARF